MAALIVDFDPLIHQKVRHRDQLYVVFLKDYDFFRLPPNAEVVIHFISRDKIFVRDDESIRQLYTVRKRDLKIVDSDTTD